MAKLTKPEAKAHAEAALLLEKDVLTDDEKEFVQLHWQESANHVNSAAGAFFTPPGLASDTALDVGGGRVIDLCAGIGSLALAVWQRQAWGRHNGAVPTEFVCVEMNPDYVAIGKKMLPEARWVTGSIFDLPDDIGHFDYAVSNPPFGKIKRDGNGGKYTGAEFEYHTIAVAAELADFGTFIIPQGSAGFQYSGRHGFDRMPSRKYETFTKQTGIVLDIGAGVDTSIYREDWHGVAPLVEIACADFTELPAATARDVEQLAFEFEAA